MTSTDKHALSPTRTKAAWKPGVFEEPLPFFRCSTCGAIFLNIDGGEGPRLTGGGRRPIIELPYAPAAPAPVCCGAPMERLLQSSATSEAIELTYDVVGGFDANALRVFWTVLEDDCELHWIALKTFTGLQLKYIVPGKKAPVLFAFADEDAYAYCDESPCLACTFHCKSGFILYACTEKTGLITLPIHREAVSS